MKAGFPNKYFLRRNAIFRIAYIENSIFRRIHPKYITLSIYGIECIRVMLVAGVALVAWALSGWGIKQRATHAFLLRDLKKCLQHL